MIKAILLDCGGVMVAPTSGDWLLTPGFEAILGEDFIARHLETFRNVRGQYLRLLPDANVVDTDDAECEMFKAYFAAVFGHMGFSISGADIARFAHLQVYVDGRYTLFDDVLPYLAKWHSRYKMGIVSDAPPSTRRIMDTWGVLSHMDGPVFSCELGILKPDRRIFEAAIEKLGIMPEEAVFVDDFPSKMEGALSLGIHCIQMRREMPPLFDMPAQWDGFVAHDFAEVDAILEHLA